MALIQCVVCARPRLGPGRPGAIDTSPPPRGDGAAAGWPGPGPALPLTVPLSSLRMGVFLQLVLHFCDLFLHILVRSFLSLGSVFCPPCRRVFSFF